jgi:hypothetical protein
LIELTMTTEPPPRRSISGSAAQIVDLQLPHS